MLDISKYCMYMYLLWLTVSGVHACCSGSR